MFNRLLIYNFFISHSWNYREQYDTLLSWLNESNIHYKDYSVPSHDPFSARSNYQLRAAISNQIRHASIVVITAGMYVAYSEWIEFEINEAIKMNKPILAIKPRGNTYMPMIVQESADCIVNWNRDSFIQGVKSLL